MSYKPIFHRLVFGLAGISVFSTGIIYLLAGCIYAYFSYKAFLLVAAFGGPNLIIIGALALIGGTAIFLILGIFHGIIGLMFFEDDDDGYRVPIWQAYSGLIYLDAVMVFCFSMFLFIGTGMIFTSADSAGIESEPSTSIFLALIIASIPLSIAILLVFVASGLSNENFIAAIALFIRNAGRLTILLLNVYLVLAIVIKFDDFPQLLTLLFSSWIVIDGVAHTLAAGILIDSTYTKAKLRNYQQEIYDDDYDDYDDLVHDISDFSSPALPLQRYSEETQPDIEWHGELGDDGYEWIEYPEQSDSWFWRDPETGDWVKH